MVPPVDGYRHIFRRSLAVPANQAPAFRLACVALMDEAVLSSHAIGTNVKTSPK